MPMGLGLWWVQESPYPHLMPPILLTALGVTLATTQRTKQTHSRKQGQAPTSPHPLLRPLREQWSKGGHSWVCPDQPYPEDRACASISFPPLSPQYGTIFVSPLPFGVLSGHVEKGLSLASGIESMTHTWTMCSPLCSLSPFPGLLPLLVCLKGWPFPD